MCSAQGPPGIQLGAPNRLGRNFYASGNAKYETAENREIMKTFTVHINILTCYCRSMSQHVEDSFIN